MPPERTSKKREGSETVVKAKKIAKRLERASRKDRSSRNAVNEARKIIGQFVRLCAPDVQKQAEASLSGCLDQWHNRPARREQESRRISKALKSLMLAQRGKTLRRIALTRKDIAGVLGELVGTGNTVFSDSCRGSSHMAEGCKRARSSGLDTYELGR